MTRRDFLVASGACAVVAPLAGFGATSPTPPLHEAMFYEPLDDRQVRCTLCPWRCVVGPGQRGRCRVRENRDGKYFSLVYGYPCSGNNDPIEKKPFFHVLPGSKAFSIATVGCNITCKFCQNWQISQATPESLKKIAGPPRYVTPDDIVAAARKAESKSIAYTYSEPTVFFEYMFDCATAARQAGLANVVISNGFISADALRKLCTVATAIKIDFKAFTTKFYEDVCGGQLEPVKETLKRIVGSGVWLEIVVLTIPTLNDDPGDIQRMSEWIVKEVGPEVPLHFTRFHPDYKLRNLPPTPVKTLEDARRIAMQQGCRFVYGGNVEGFVGENTYCPDCKNLVIDRHGHSTVENRLKDGKCPQCSRAIPGRWN